MNGPMLTMGQPNSRKKIHISCFNSLHFIFSLLSRLFIFFPLSENFNSSFDIQFFGTASFLLHRKSTFISWFSLIEKFWYHLLTIELYRNNLSYEFIHYIPDLIKVFYIYFHFHWESHIFLIQKENIFITNPSFIVWGMWSHAHTSTHA